MHFENMDKSTVIILLQILTFQIFIYKLRFASLEYDCITILNICNFLRLVEVKKINIRQHKLYKWILIKFILSFLYCLLNLNGYGKDFYQKLQIKDIIF